MEDPYWGIQNEEEIILEPKNNLNVKASKMPKTEIDSFNLLKSPSAQNKKWMKYSQRDMKIQ